MAKILQKIDNTDELSVVNGNFIAKKNDKGIYVYKATDAILFKKDKKVLKKKYHDLPRYKAVNQYENSFKNHIDDYLKNMTLDLVKKMKHLVK